ncbi:hypothetical protein NEOC65_001567 [Neochlamydia sp. AcF65]|nr:hypothetical protein [Neochlamydia sp. AcF65]
MMAAPIQRNESQVFLTTIGAETPISLAAPAEQAQVLAPDSHTINVNDSLARKLDNPSEKLPPEESIAVLMECIRRGEIEAEKAKDQELVMVIGNTGCGKSTFSNAMYGCTMKKVAPTRRGEGIGSRVIVEKGSARDEVMKIGHTNNSQTFMPQLIEIENHVSICDCPGFLDNRGYEINIANVTNIRKVFTKAKSVKVVVLINYYSLLADRARGLQDAINICCNLFGSKENLVKHKNAILLGITHIPSAHPDEEKGSLNDLKEIIRKIKLINEFEETTLRELSERLFIYDPVDPKELEYAEALTKEEVLSKIAELECIQNPKAIFKTALNNSDIKELIDIFEQIQKNIKAILDKASLSDNDFKTIADYLHNLQKLEIIDHPRIFKLVAETRQLIAEHFREMIKQFDRCCADESYRLEGESRAILASLEKGIQHFDNQIQSQFNIEDLQKRFALSIKRKAAGQAARELAGLHCTFLEKLNLNDFVSAECSLQEIKYKLGIFEREYQEINISPEIDLQKLERQYIQKKTMYGKERLTKLANIALGELKSLVEQFTRECAIHDWEGARRAIDKIKQEVHNFEKDYHTTDLSHSINTEELESFFITSKANYDKDQLTKLANIALGELKSLVEQFTRECATHDWEGAKRAIDKIKQEVHNFEKDYHKTDLSHSINTKELESFFITSKANYDKYQAEKALLPLTSLETQFRIKCAQNDFEGAKSLLEEIKRTLPAFEAKYRHTGLPSNINIDQLESFFITSKKQYKEKQIKDYLDQHTPSLSQPDQSSPLVNTNRLLIWKRIPGGKEILDEEKVKCLPLEKKGELFKVWIKNYGEDIKYLDLSAMDLTCLPPEIGELSQLQHLNLEKNHLTSLPTEIRQLSKLQYLYLNYSQLTSLPAWIGQLSQLRNLYLKGNQLTTLPAEIGQLSQLQYLNLEKNRLTSLPTEIRQLSKLQYLYLNYNQLTPLPTSIGQLSQLQYLYLNSNQLTTLPAELGQLSNLLTLGLEDNRLTSLPAKIGQLSKLRYLYLGGNQLASLPAEIGQLTCLQFLYLNYNQLTSLPAWRRQLSKLERLDLRGNKLTFLPAELGQLSNLQYLELENNQLTSLPAEIGQLSHLQKLNLTDNQLTSLHARIGKLSQLQELDLSSNQLTSLPAEIGQLSKLKELHLGNNQLTSLPAEIGQLSHLLTLSLVKNGLTSLPAEIGQLSRLHDFNLSINKLTSLPAEIVGQLSGLGCLSLDDNQLTSLPAWIGQLPNLYKLHLNNNQLTSLPTWIGQLTLGALRLENNRLTSLPAEIEQLSKLWGLSLDGNPLSNIPAKIKKRFNL